MADGHEESSKIALSLRMKCAGAIVFLALAFWVPAVIALCRGFAAMLSNLSHSARFEYRGWLKAIKCVVWAFATGRKCD